MDEEGNYLEDTESKLERVPTEREVRKYFQQLTFPRSGSADEVEERGSGGCIWPKIEDEEE